jgi:cytochrome c
VYSIVNTWIKLGHSSLGSSAGPQIGSRRKYKLYGGRMLSRMFVAGAVALCLTGCGRVGMLRPPGDPTKPAFYQERVRPILQDHCGSCHFGMSHKGGLNMSTKAGLLKGGRDGVVLIPGDPANSLMVKLMRHEGPSDDPMPMPPFPRRKVSDADIAEVVRWIQAGAVMPDDGTTQ